MTADEGWARALEIFNEVVEQPAADRPHELHALCAGDQLLRSRVEALLAADAPSSQVLDDGAARLFGDLLDGEAPAVARWIGRQLGPYRVVREIGSGGMGVVFLAERCDGQFEQRVALKVARLGLSSDESVRGFVAERRILAGLEHPRIARLLDGGVTPEGLPFFAMEYVAGTTITEHCEANGLGLARRIELFVAVCDAVDYAHRRLVVHRDLKPANILVTPEGEVKLLDFGVAKLLDGESGSTRTLEHALTPAYAAPEQIRGEAVTTATDVYALGGVLHELLVGQRPFGSARSPDAVALAKLHGEPERPSAAVADGDQRAGSTAIARRRRALRGDLDTILLTALRGEPERRYPSAAALGEDLVRHLARQPIRARADSLRYRAGKFAARHAWTVSIAASLLAALLVALVVAVAQARAAAREALASQEVTSFLVRLFEAPDPTLSRGSALSAQELLDEGVDRLRSDLHGEPAVRARLLGTMAGTYAALGVYDRARELAGEALRLRRASFAADSAEVAESTDQLGEIERLQGDLAHAEPLLRAALATRRARLGAGAPPLLESLGHVGALLEDRGRFAAAEGLYREALAGAEARFGAQSTAVARRLDDFATNQADLGRETAAVALRRRALAIRERALGRGAPAVATSLVNLGDDLDRAGQYPEAADALERALAIRRRVLGPRHPLVGAAEIALAGVLADENRLDEAGRASEAALAILRGALPGDHPKIREALNMVGVIRVARRDFAGAVPPFRELLARYTRVSGRSHPDTLTVENNLAVALMHTGELQEAESLQREVLRLLPADDGQATATMTRQNLAGTLDLEGKLAAAVDLAREALQVQRRREGMVSANVAVALRSLGVAEELNGEGSRAEADFRAGLTMGTSLARTRRIAIYEWKVPLADLLVGAQRCDEALPLLASATAEIAGVETADPIWRPQIDLLAARCDPSSERRDARMRVASRTLRALPAVDVDLYPTARGILRRSTE